jgi:hypothetical protein
MVLRGQEVKSNYCSPTSEDDRIRRLGRTPERHQLQDHTMTLRSFRPGQSLNVEKEESPGRR